MVRRLASLKAGQDGVLVLDTHAVLRRERRPGGRRGAVFSDAGLFEVGDTQKIKADVFGHRGTLEDRRSCAWAMP